MSTPITTFPVFIVGSKWKVLIYDSATYAAINGEDSKAVCDDKKKNLEFDIGELSKKIIRHELTHAYIAEMSFYELQLEPEQHEEFTCELMGKFGERIVLQAANIFNHAMKIKTPHKKDLVKVISPV